MYVERHGRRRIIKPGEREAARVKLVLLALILLSSCGLLIGVLANGVRDGLLSLSMPAYKRLPAARAESTLVPVQTAEPEVRLTVSDAETLYHSVETVWAAKNEPQILIYHTHATEAYLQTAEDPYTESGKWRTEEAESSVVAIGALLAQTLTSAYGRDVLHDTTNHEPPKLSTAYSRSLKTMLSYQSRYPSISVFIDLHRDAYGTSNVQNGEPKDFIELDGKEVARIMLVVGTGKGATGAGFDDLPDFDANYAFAEAVTEELSGTDERLARDIRVKTGRYNQHVSPRCLLVEVGHNANTLEQAKNAVPYLAKAIDRALDAGIIKAASAPAMDVWTPPATEGSD